MSDSSCQVLVVGAGPVGLFLACDLARRGVAVRVVDQLEAPVSYSKALWVHTRTMEALRELGIVNRFLEAARPARGLRMHSPGYEAIFDLDLTHAKEDTRYPMIYHLSQRRTEQFLTERLASVGVSVERGVRLSTLAQDDEGVTATLAHQGGREEIARVPWVFGADGGRSTVRKQLGLLAVGKTYEASIVQADCRIDWPCPMPDDVVMGFLSARMPVLAFPLPETGRYRLLSLDAGAEESIEFLQKALVEAGCEGAKVHDPEWVVKFTVHCRMVDRYRVGRVFIGGDAAHLHSPAGGQGMNTGIQDAWNIGWKLALVVKGAAAPELLDSYGAERLPVARAVLNGTDRGFDNARLGARKPGVLTTMRNQLMQVVTSLDLVRDAASRTISELDIGYPESPIVGEARESLWRTRVTSSPDDESPAVRDWFGFGGGPGPGARVPDLPVSGIESAERVYDVLGRDYTLLLFDGAAATVEGYQKLAGIARDVAGRLGGHVRVHIVVPSSSRPAALGDQAPVLLDPQAELHRAFGARSECLYLLRPDRYVAFRSLPANGEALQRHLENGGTRVTNA